MRPLNFLFAAFLIGGCAIQKSENTDPNTRSIQIHGTVHKPYCGGAKPSPDVAAGYYESMKHEKFKLMSGTELSSAKEVQDVELDVAGNVTLQLEPGNYLLIQSDKLLSTDEFMKLNGPVVEQHYEIKERACFEKWQQTIDLNFTVVGDTIIEMRKQARCFTGTNPCIQYTGPYPP
ncbi:MAG: hypothetical protein EP305_06190 [Bacteroidetes bacterium]|nr:MAG: hypothetical protein EP305_06190 [Bacteroidota bacterium]